MVRYTYKKREHSFVQRGANLSHMIKLAGMPYFDAVSSTKAPPTVIIHRYVLQGN